MPATPPSQARRGSTRTRIAAATSSQSSLTSASTKPGTAALTRAQQQQQQKQQDASLSHSSPSSAPASSPNTTPGRPGRPRKDQAPPPVPAPPAFTQDEEEDQDRPRRGRGRQPRTRELTMEPSTPPASGSSSAEHEEARSPSSSSAARETRDTGNVHVEEDKDELRSPSQPSTRSSNLQRPSTRTFANASKRTDRSSTHSSGSGSSSSSTGSEAPEQSEDRGDSQQVSEDREMEDASSESEDEDVDVDVDSDEDHRQQNSGKGKHTKTTVPSKRRLRSSRLMPSVVAHLAADSNGLTIDQILDEYTEEQQLLRADVSAAEALARLFRQGIQESESLHPDMVDAQDYELIRHTFGEIEDLSLNLTGTLMASDESSAEDDDLTIELKRKHRRAKRNVMDVSAQYRAVKRRMTIQMIAQLDAEEAQIKAGTHPELLAELKAIEDRRQARIKAVQAQKDYHQRMWDINFQSVCKAANDQYHAGQVAARKNVIDMVQSRMNRIKQEMAQCNREAALSAPRRLTFVKTVEGGDYDSCGESCSSYDSYSSSGSECSDCEICRTPRHLQIPRLRAPKGLSRREVALDLAFLFPPSGSKGSRHQQDDSSRRSLQPSSEDEDLPHSRSSNNQQYMIDHLNEERRRKRRVLDREMQNKAAYKKHSAPEKIGKGEGAYAHDMDVDQDQDQDEADHQEREMSSADVGSRARSPIHLRSTPRLSARKRTKYYRPRFLPGFGPDGLQTTKHPPGVLPGPRQTPKYLYADRHGRPGIPESSRPNGDESRPYPPIGRESARMQAARSPQESNGNHLSQVYVQQHLRQQELQDAAYRSKHSRHQAGPMPLHKMYATDDVYLSKNNPKFEHPARHEPGKAPPRTFPPEDVYPYEGDKKFIFKDKLSQPFTAYRGDFYHPRGGPLKDNKVQQYLNPVLALGPNNPRGGAPLRDYPSIPSSSTPRHLDGSSPRLSAAGCYEDPRPRLEEESYSGRRSPSFATSRSSRAQMDGSPNERFAAQYSSSAPASSSMPPPRQSSASSSSRYPYTGSSPSLVHRQRHHQPNQNHYQPRMMNPQSPYIRDPRERPAPILIDLSSPPTSPKQSPAVASSQSAPVSAGGEASPLMNGQQQNGIGSGQDPSRPPAMSPRQYTTSIGRTSLTQTRQHSERVSVLDKN